MIRARVMEMAKVGLQRLKPANKTTLKRVSEYCVCVAEAYSDISTTNYSQLELFGRANCNLQTDDVSTTESCMLPVHVSVKIGRVLHKTPVATNKLYLDGINKAHNLRV